MPASPQTSTEHLHTEDAIQAGYHPPAAQRRKERQRRQIIEVATELYLQNGGADGGFAKTTVEDIAERADISVRTFFRYFNSKADVIFLDGKRANEDMLSMLNSRLSEQPLVAAVVGASMDLLHWFIGDPLNRERLRRSLRAPEFKERLAAIREQEQLVMFRAISEKMQGRPDAIVMSASIAMIVRGAVWQALDAWAHNQTKDPEEMALRIYDSLAPIVRDIATAGRAWGASRSCKNGPKARRSAKSRAPK